MRLGNGRWENTEFNSRLQPTKIGLGSGVASQSLLKLEYSYGSTANNGNVVEQKITVPGVAHPYIQAYTYDELNRLATAEETKNSSQEWKQTFVYDRYGNRNFATISGATTAVPSAGRKAQTAVGGADGKSREPSSNIQTRVSQTARPPQMLILNSMRLRLPLHRLHQPNMLPSRCHFR